MPASRKRKKPAPAGKRKRRPRKKPDPEKPRKKRGKKDRFRRPYGMKPWPVKLEGWLANRPAIRGALVWEKSVSGEAGVPMPYAAWSPAMKQQLQDAYLAAWNGQPTGLVDPPANLVNPGDDEFPWTAIEEPRAWALYVTHVAHGLAAETGHWVAGSLMELTADQLPILFDSRAMFSWAPQFTGYLFGQIEQRGIPAPPDAAYAFLAQSGLLGSTRLKTIINIIGWCRANLIHFDGQFQAANVFDQWQYRGVPPVTRILAGTPVISHPEWGIDHRTAGCHGTLSFLRAMLRTANIPVARESECGHALVSFPSEAKYLSHGDDPYGGLTKATPPFGAALILTEKSMYESWFGPGVPEQKRCDNVGRRPRDLALVYLPDYLLWKYCQDVAAGTSHADGQVYAMFAKDHTLSYLENTVDLWGKIAAKVAAMGGCGAIKPI